MAHIIGCLKFLLLLCGVGLLQQPPSDLAIVHEGESISGVRIGMTVSQADSVLNARYERIPWVGYSFEHAYRSVGLSVWTMQSDSGKTIFAISVDPNKWNGRTKRGLTVSGDLSIQDVIRVYGKPEWVCTEGSASLSAEYEDQGIYFEVTPLNGDCGGDDAYFDSVYYNRPVTGITIGEVGTDY